MIAAVAIAAVVAVSAALVTAAAVAVVSAREDVASARRGPGLAVRVDIPGWSGTSGPEERAAA